MNNENYTKKDLVKLVILVASVLVIIVGLAIINSQNAMLDKLASKLFS